MKTTTAASWIAATAILLACPLPTLIGEPTPPAHENAEIRVSKATWDPDTVIEVSFPRMMVSEDELNQAMDNGAVVIIPALPLQLTWTSPRVARIEIDGLPRAATTYTLTTSQQAEDLLGTRVAPAEPVKLQTPDLNLHSAQTPLPMEGAPPRQSRQPAHLLIWNAPVDASELSHSFIMRDDDDTVILCNVRQAQWQELGVHARRLLPWQESMELGQRLLEDEEIPHHDPDHPVPHALVVEPVQLLPPGQNWTLVIPEGITASHDDRVRTTEETTQRVGHIANFTVHSIQPHSGINIKNAIAIRFNKPISQSAIDSDLLRWVQVSPEPHGGITTELIGATLYLHGNFNFNSTYKVSVKPGLQANDDTLLAKAVNSSHTFIPESPQIGLPSLDNVQILHGSGNYPISYANLSNIRVRVKAIAPENAGFAINAIQYYQNQLNARHHRRHHDDQDARQNNQGFVPFEFLAGTTLYDETKPTQRGADNINKGHSFNLNWQDILPENNPPTLLFLSVEGTPAYSPEGVRQTVSQTFLQITDIGLIWKSAAQNNTLDIFSFSHHSGKPTANIKASLLSAEGQTLSHSLTDNSGTASLTLPDNIEGAYLLLKNPDGDSRVVSSQALGRHLSPWQIGASRFTSWAPDQAEVTRLNHLFTERNLYRPGETVHLKGTHRYLENDRPVVPGDVDEVTLKVKNPNNRVIHEESLAFSEFGTFDFTFTLPPDTLGHYNIEVVYPHAYEDEETWRRTFNHYFQAAEFRRNAFEITIDANESYIAPEAFEFPVEATYYLGAPCANAHVSWTLQSQSSGFYPERFREFFFGDHRKPDHGYWAHYYGFHHYSRHYSHDSTIQSGTGNADPTGRLTINADAPDHADFPTIRTSTLNTEVTDANQQTLFASKSFTIHPASFYLGIQRIDKLARTGDTIDLDLIAVDTDQKPLDETINATLTIEKLVWDTIEIETAGGGTSQRNESELIPVSEEEITLTNGTGSLNLTFDEAAEYHITLSATDANNNETRTTISLHVYGENTSAWEIQRGINFDILPDKRSYKPGDTAKLLLKSPITGTAYITLEHHTTSRTIVQQLTGDQSVLEIPLKESDAPNVFVSAIVVKGTDDSPMKHPIPLMRIGYAELKVENAAPRITIDVEPTSPSVRPGSEATVALTLTNYKNNPVANAEVTLYAVDMGVLAVSNSPDPDPLSTFYPERRLLVQTGSGISHLLPEDPSRLNTHNKGFLIGGGFDDLRANLTLRHDFRPCAFWQADIISDENGKAEATFVVPDTLTRYRIIAVANTTDGLFGTGTGELEVNKPIMIEPAVPRFAHAGDQITLKAQILNQSPFDGTFSVELALDSLASAKAPSSSHPTTREITLAAGEHGSLDFPVTFHTHGQTTLQWQVTPVRLDNHPTIPDPLELSDAVQSQFDIVHPIPLLTQIRSHRMEKDASEIDLSGGLEARLLEGEGELVVLIANTRMIEVLPAIDHLLRYPYGCLEQTTSSLIPWIAIHGWQDVLPTPRDPEEVAETIRFGISRLLSMQNHEGGFGYWSGSDASNLWGTCHAAIALLLANEQGIDVPQESIDQFTAFLSRQLRTLDTENNDVRNTRPDLAAALYVLALAGKPEPAYHEWFLKRLDTLRANEAFYLSLAIANGGGDTESALKAYHYGHAILTGENDENISRRWYPSSQTNSLALIASCQLDFDFNHVEDHLDRLLGKRNTQGHWSTTYTNSWSLLAMDAYRKAFETSISSTNGTLVLGDRSIEIDLPDKPTSINETLVLQHNLPSTIKFIRSEDDQRNLFFHVELRSRPKEMPRQRSDRGLTITRTYQRVLNDGSLANADRLQIGDMVAVTLDVTTDKAGEYFVIDDPLPSTLEAINPNFTSQGGSREAMAQQSTWTSSHTELRDDRALFFCNRIWTPGNFQITYLARVSGVGKAMVPGTLIEAMYDPEFYGLTEPMLLETHPREE